jgi:hypothetical protein
MTLMTADEQDQFVKMLHAKFEAAAFVDLLLALGFGADHAIDIFDRLTAHGFKLNLVTGEYYRP